MAGTWMRVILYPFVMTLLLSTLSSGQSEEKPCQLTDIGNIKCCDTQCPKGMQPRCFDATPPPNLDYSCEPCPDDMYASFPTEPHRRCKHKKKCELGPNMIYINKGRSIEDAECGCEDGYEYNPRAQICTFVGIPSTSTPSGSFPSPNSGNISEPASDEQISLGAILVPCIFAVVLVCLVTLALCKKMITRKRHDYGDLPQQDPDQDEDKTSPDMLPLDPNDDESLLRQEEVAADVINRQPDKENTQSVSDNKKQDNPESDDNEEDLAQHPYEDKTSPDMLPLDPNDDENLLRQEEEEVAADVTKRQPASNFSPPTGQENLAHPRAMLQQLPRQEPLCDCLRNNGTLILDKLIVTEKLLAILKDKGVITKEEKEQICEKDVNTVKTSKLKDIVETRGEEKIRIFLDALVEENQDDLVKKLTQDIPGYSIMKSSAEEVKPSEPMTVKKEATAGATIADLGQRIKAAFTENMDALEALDIDGLSLHILRKNILTRQQWEKIKKESDSIKKLEILEETLGIKRDDKHRVLFAKVLISSGQQLVLQYLNVTKKEVDAINEKDLDED